VTYFAVRRELPGMSQIALKIAARMADMGGAVLAGSPADFGKLIADETDKWEIV
jgi:hypothetical protein